MLCTPHSSPLTQHLSSVIVCVGSCPSLNLILFDRGMNIDDGRGCGYWSSNLMWLSSYKPRRKPAFGVGWSSGLVLKTSGSLHPCALYQCWFYPLWLWDSCHLCLWLHTFLLPFMRRKWLAVDLEEGRSLFFEVSLGFIGRMRSCAHFWTNLCVSAAVVLLAGFE